MIYLKAATTGLHIALCIALIIGWVGLTINDKERQNEHKQIIAVIAPAITLSILSILAIWW